MMVSKITFDNLIKLISSINHLSNQKRLSFIVATDGRLTNYVAGIGMYLDDLNRKIDSEYYYYIMRRDSDNLLTIIYIKDCKTGDFFDDPSLIKNKCNIESYSQIRYIIPTQGESDLGITYLDNIKIERDTLKETELKKHLIAGFSVDDFTINDIEKLPYNERHKLYEQNKSTCEIYDLETFLHDLNHDFIDAENYFWLQIS